MYFTVYFTDDGSPKTGLTPTITIVDLSDDSVVVNGAEMSEILTLSGEYKYLFVGHNPEKDYVAQADGGAILTNDNERYVPCSSGINALGEIVEGTLSLRAVARILLSVASGKAEGGGSAEIRFRSLADDKARATMAVDSNGNRLESTVDGA